MKFDFIPDSVSHFDNAYDVLKERDPQAAAERKS